MRLSPLKSIADPLSPSFLAAVDTGTINNLVISTAESPIISSFIISSLRIGRSRISSLTVEDEWIGWTYRNTRLGLDVS